ncbi:MAG: AsmA-like C-terminal region-containing protein [Methylophilus sp.]|nr:AsmA-like C-terminal region-containing protein [Methylophilus sp.]
MKMSKKIGLGLLVILGLLLVLPFLIPMDTYVRQAERLASEKLGVPVTIAKANVFFLPSLRLSVSDVVVGKSQELTVHKLVLMPTLTSLFSKQRVVDVKLEQVVAKKSVLRIYEELSQPKSNEGEPSPVIIRNLSIQGLAFIWPDVSIPTTNIELSLEDNRPAVAKLDAVDGKLSAVLSPIEGGQHIVLKAKHWQLPIKTPLELTEGDFDMTLKGNKLDVPKFTMKLYDGVVTGSSSLSWGKVWRTSGQFAINSLSIETPSRLANPNTYMSGRLDGHGNFASQAKEASQLADHIQITFPFAVKQGVLHGLDLVKAASLIVKQDAAGGETQFDTFSGQLAVTGQQYQLSNMDVSSGLLSANGHVTITPQKKLTGTVEVELKKSVGLVAVPLNVSGTLDHPVVLPSNAALAGAAVGTAVLGPGVGTSLGIKASKGLDKLKGLFGGD